MGEELALLALFVRMPIVTANIASVRNLHRNPHLTGPVTSSGITRAWNITNERICPLHRTRT